MMAHFNLLLLLCYHACISLSLTPSSSVGVGRYFAIFFFPHCYKELAVSWRQVYFSIVSITKSTGTLFLLFLSLVSHAYFVISFEMCPALYSGETGKSCLCSKHFTQTQIVLQDAVTCLCRFRNRSCNHDCVTAVLTNETASVCPMN